jgi:DNA-binding CsgD family transcriptional regulator
MATPGTPGTTGTPDDRPPVVLVDDPADVEQAAIEPGWRSRTGFALPARPRDLSSHRWVCRGVVATRDDARAAVEALERGVGLVVALAVAGRDRLALLEDLDRVGRLCTPVDEAFVLDDDQRRLLALLADGATVAVAAQQAGVSLRTANRRLADARSRLGVDSTVEAIVHRDRHG